MIEPRQVVMLYGLGEDPSAWEPLIEQIPNTAVVTPALFTPATTEDKLNLRSLTDRVAEEMPGPADIVGLSLGAVVGLDLAIRYPILVRSLFLSAPQAKPPRWLMRIQSGAMRLLPSKITCPPNLSKPQMLRLLDSVTRLNLKPDLSSVSVPTTIACGSKDVPNLSAAKAIAREIPGAQFVLVPGAGHR